MSVYRSTYALTKLFGITQPENGLLSDASNRAPYNFLSQLKQDVTPIGYSTRLQFTDLAHSASLPSKRDNLEASLATNLHEINQFILQLVDNKKQNLKKLPIVITHNFTKGEIDISANSPQITAILEAAFSCEHGHRYRSLAWDSFQLLKSSSKDGSAIYLFDDDHNTVTALTNPSALQLHIEEKPGNER